MTSEISVPKPVDHDYINIIVSRNGEQVINYRESPEAIGSSLRHHPYVNVPVKQKGVSSSPQKDFPRNGIDNKNLPNKTRDKNHGSLSRDGNLRRYLSETELLSRKVPSSPSSTDEVKMPSYFHNVSNIMSLSPEQAIANAKMRLLLPQEFTKGKDCDNCDHLIDLLSTWQIRSGNLTRNYSRILGLLIRIRTAAICLESRFEQQASPSVTGSNAAASSLLPAGGLPTTAAATAAPCIRHPPSSRPLKNRQSMFVTHTGMASGAIGIRERDLAENMYPRYKDGIGNPISSPSQAMVNSSTFTKDLKDLNSHLGDAINLCQELAAACFKNTYLSKSPQNHVANTIHTSGFVEKLSMEAAEPGSDYGTILHAMTEVRHRTLGRAPSAPSLECSTEYSASVSGKTQSDSGSDFAMAAVDAETSLANLECDQNTSESCRSSSKDQNGMAIGVSLSGNKDMKDRVETESGSNPACTYSESDVKFVMSKIASLEEERYRLLETIDQFHHDNSTLRLSLQELLENLGNKDLQVRLAMQDLSIATGEIKMAAEMRKKLQHLSSDRDALLVKLGSLEDESSAMKVSLIQLVQETSATNKALALENWRLTQQIQGTGTSGHDSNSNDVVHSSSSSAGGDNDSTHSGGLSAGADVNTMQKGTKENFVHKQGFLVKQGGRVKTWRKRLFVLDANELAYYKTEQPIQTLPIDKIEKVQICHERCQQPHTFEVHTQGRVFYMSASSADEMQSWVGMLQTLKEYKRSNILCRGGLKVKSEVSRSKHAVTTNSNGHTTQETSANGHTSHLTTSPGYASDDAPSPVRTRPNSNEEGDSEEEQQHIVLHQEVVPNMDNGDDSSYIFSITSGASVPSAVSML